MTLDGGDGLHVEISGRGPPLVLLHGWAMHGGVFAPLVQRLQDAFTLHVVDLPGHGQSRSSTVPLQLDACVDAIARLVPRAPWCGWSMGGLFALHAAAKRSSQVPALVMLCASPCFVRALDWKYGVSADIFCDFANGLRSESVHCETPSSRTANQRRRCWLKVWTCCNTPICAAHCRHCRCPACGLLGAAIGWSIHARCVRRLQPPRMR
jgi:pimeloyl-ACP methyl ester esterase